MTKRTSAKYKIDRRMGENIWGRPKSPVNRREYGPGQHGQRRKGKMSDFGLQLRAKQKLKGYYGDVTEKQFRRVYEDASRRKGNTAEHLIGILEQRLDDLLVPWQHAGVVHADAAQQHLLLALLLGLGFGDVETIIIQGADNGNAFGHF